MDHVKNCHPKPHHSDNSSHEKSWGDNSSYGLIIHKVATMIPNLTLSPT